MRRPLAGFGFWLHRPRPPLARIGLTQARQTGGIRRSGPPSPALPLEPLTRGAVVPTGPQLAHPGQSRGLTCPANLPSPSDKQRSSTPKCTHTSPSGTSWPPLGVAEQQRTFTPRHRRRLRHHLGQLPAKPLELRVHVVHDELDDGASVGSRLGGPNSEQRDRLL